MASAIDGVPPVSSTVTSSLNSTLTSMGEPMPYVSLGVVENTDRTVGAVPSIGVAPMRPSEPDPDSVRVALLPAKSFRLPAVVSASVPL